MPTVDEVMAQHAEACGNYLGCVEAVASAQRLLKTRELALVLTGGKARKKAQSAVNRAKVSLVNATNRRDHWINEMDRLYRLAGALRAGTLTATLRVRDTTPTAHGFKPRTHLQATPTGPCPTFARFTVEQRAAMARDADNMPLPAVAAAWKISLHALKGLLG